MPDVRAYAFMIMTFVLAGCAKEGPAPAAEPASTASSEESAQGEIREFRIGELSAVALRDGELRFPNDNKVFGMGRSPEEVATLLRGAGLPTDELSLSIQPLLVRAGSKVLLFDTGVGTNWGITGQLVTAMQQAGVAPMGVTDVFISHMHGDHVGGLVDPAGALVFANATIHMSAPEWEYVKGMDEQTAAAVGLGNQAAFVAALSSKINAFEPGAEILPGIVKAVEIEGHTPGHSGYLIGSGADTVLYIGDTAHHYVVSVQEPEWTIAFDGEAPTAQASRKKVIAESAAAGQRVYAVHFPFPGIGKFASSGESFVWSPEE